MAKTPKSELMQLMTLLRRILVLSVAVWGLARGLPFDTLALRLVGLWAMLYICSGVVDVIFRRMSYRTVSDSAASAGAPASATEAATRPSRAVKKAAKPASETAEQAG
ncbi:MAG: hypothetical protein PHI18_05160 [bacterium]|nr:hypothetical protein [bacterium]